MNDLKENLLYLEDTKTDAVGIYEKGSIPVLITSVHSMEQVRSDGSIKKSEPLTKAIAMYVASKTNSSYMIKVNDNGIDPNHVREEEFKNHLLDFVKENNILLVIDLHGAKIDRDFDVEMGTMNNLTADFSTIKEFEDAFRENNINNIAFNNPFKGGYITQTLYNLKDVEVIQLEINYKYRDLDNMENVGNLINSLISFITHFTSK